MGYGWRLHSWSGLISPGVYFATPVRLIENRIVCCSSDDEAALLVRRHGADGSTGGAGNGQKKNIDHSESRALTFDNRLYYFTLM